MAFLVPNGSPRTSPTAVQMEFESPTSAKPLGERSGYLLLFCTQNVRSDRALRGFLPKAPHFTGAKPDQRSTHGELEAGPRQYPGLLTPPCPPQPRASSSFSLPLCPQLADQETEAQNWRVRGRTGPGPRPPGSTSRIGKCGPRSGHSTARTQA